MKSREDLETNEQEISTKRKHSSNSSNNSISQQDLEGEDEDDFDLTLSLSFGPLRSKKKTALKTIQNHSYHCRCHHLNKRWSLSLMHPTIATAVGTWLLFWKLMTARFEPAPRRGEPDVTRRTPDYFL
ncbi:hypothetical protein NC652_000205 [Populus alba x Populus x berolinensis]|nr:hypothetical protein NC652_000205 [Populus alba x Populus x berolinensis]